MGWVLPTGDVPGYWAHEFEAYDGGLSTFAYCDVIDEYLELTHDGLSCDKVRIYATDADYSGEWINNVDPDFSIDVYYSGGWHNIFSGTVTHDSWVEKTIGSTQTVTAVKIKANSMANAYVVVFEVNFNEAEAPPPLHWQPIILIR